MHDVRLAAIECLKELSLACEGRFKASNLPYPLQILLEQLLDVDAGHQSDLFSHLPVDDPQVHYGLLRAGQQAEAVALLEYLHDTDMTSPTAAKRIAGILMGEDSRTLAAASTRSMPYLNGATRTLRSPIRSSSSSTHATARSGAHSLSAYARRKPTCRERCRKRFTGKACFGCSRRSFRTPHTSPAQPDNPQIGKTAPLTSPRAPRYALVRGQLVASVS